MVSKFSTTTRQVKIARYAALTLGIVVVIYCQAIGEGFGRYVIGGGLFAVISFSFWPVEMLFTKIRGVKSGGLFISVVSVDETYDSKFASMRRDFSLRILSICYWAAYANVVLLIIVSLVLSESNASHIGAAILGLVLLALHRPVAKLRRATEGMTGDFLQISICSEEQANA